MVEPVEVYIYVDGSCSHGPVPFCGYGVYYGENDPKNASVAMSTLDSVDKFIVPSAPRAELAAIRHALRDVVMLENTNIRYYIFADSLSQIEAITINWKKWSKKGWLTNSGEPVRNQDLIKQCVDLHQRACKIYKKKGWGQLYILHVKGHNGVEGNEQADRLAVAGALEDERLHKSKQKIEGDPNSENSEMKIYDPNSDKQDVNETPSVAEVLETKHSSGDDADNKKENTNSNGYLLVLSGAFCIYAVHLHQYLKHM